MTASLSGAIFIITRVVRKIMKTLPKIYTWKDNVLIQLRVVNYLLF